MVGIRLGLLVAEDEGMDEGIAVGIALGDLVVKDVGKADI